ncbi:UNVERIFIED_CONTAM: hypothetical protein HDU68_000235, partial [Siphonaria sp. JEL0065]
MEKETPQKTMYKSKSLKSVATTAPQVPTVPSPPLPSTRSSGVSLATGESDATPKASASHLQNSKVSSSLSSNVLTAASTSPLAQTTLILRVLITSMSVTKSLRTATSETVWSLKKQIIEKMNKDIKDVLNFGIYVPPTGGKNGKGRFLDDMRTIESYNIETNTQVEFTVRKRTLPGNMEKITDSEAMPTAKNQKKFMEDLAKGNVDKIRDRCAKGFDPNFETETGDIPLCVAVMQDDSDLLHALLDHGASMDFRCSDKLHGRAALHVAVSSNKLNAVRTLLHRGAWIEIPDAQGLTPLYYAVSGSHHECVSRLLELKADTSHACLNNSGQVTGLLIDYGYLDIEAINVAGNTPLHLTATRNAVESARRLLIRGADREKTNKFGNTALQMAVLSGSTEVADLIKSFTAEQIIPPPPQYSPENTPMLPKKASIISTISETPIINAYFGDTSPTTPIIQEATQFPGTSTKSPTQSLSKESIHSTRLGSKSSIRIPGPPPGPPPSLAAPGTLKRANTVSESRPKTSFSDPASSPRTSQASLKSATDILKSKSGSPHSSSLPPPLRDRVLNQKSNSRPMSLNISRASSESVLAHANANRRLSETADSKSAIATVTVGEFGGSNVSIHGSSESKFGSTNQIRVSVAPSTNMMSMGMMSSMNRDRLMGSFMSIAPSAVPAVPIGEADVLVATIARLKELVQGGLHSHVDAIMAELDSLSGRCK